MGKIARFSGNLQAFGSAATGTERTVFGDVAQSDILDDNINADFLAGWENGLDVNDFPPQQYFNAVSFTATQLAAYLHQMGIAEYDAAQEYHIGSSCSIAGIWFVSKTDDNIGNDPLTDAVNWRNPLAEIGTPVDSLFDLVSIVDGSRFQATNRSFFDGLNKGGGNFYYDSSLNKNTANGGTIVDPDTIGGFDGTTSTVAAFLTAQGTGVGSGCWVRSGPDRPSFYTFGSSGDGTTNTTVPIQATLDAGLQEIPLCPGTFLVAFLTVPALRLIGEGGEFKFILGATPSGLALQDSAEVLGCKFDVSGSDSLGTSACIDIEGNDVKVRENIFDGKLAGPTNFKFNYTVRLSDTLSNLRTEIIGNQFINTYFGIIRQNGSPGDFSFSKININTFTGVNKGDAIELNVGEGEGVQIHSNIISGVANDGDPNTGIAIGVAGDVASGGPEADETRRFSILGNIITDAVRGIHVEGCNSFIIGGNEVAEITHATEGGIQVYSSDNWIIDGNNVSSCITAGIQVLPEGADESTTGTIGGNLVKDCPRGIEIVSDVADSVITISANTIKGSTGRGIGIAGGSDFTLSGNAVEDSVAGYNLDMESNSNTLTLSGNSSTNNTNDFFLIDAVNTEIHSRGNDFIADASPALTIAVDDTTPDVSEGNDFNTSENTGATAITSFSNALDGQIITVRGGSSTNSSTIADSGDFRLSGAITLDINNNITLRWNRALGIWTELSRSIN